MLAQYDYLLTSIEPTMDQEHNEPWWAIIGTDTAESLWRPLPSRGFVTISNGNTSPSGIKLKANGEQSSSASVIEATRGDHGAAAIENHKNWSTQNGK